MSRKISRKYLVSGVAILMGAALAFAFWPRPMAVDMGKVKRGAMAVTIDEEGRTRVHDAYVVSTPVAGRLLRVDVEPGDRVIAGQTVIGRMRPSSPTPLDVRDKAQAMAGLSSAEAALGVARARRDAAAADKELADVRLERIRPLASANLESRDALDRAVREARTSAAAFRGAQAAIAMQKAEVARARARLIDFEDDTRQGSGLPTVPIYAPVTGRVLRLMQESETILSAGTAVLEIGDIDNDLEVIAELLSFDAVRVSCGDRVMIKGWGGSTVLNGVVDRVDPWGFTKVSALGVEEQRVNTIIRFIDPPKARKDLGHGFRVEVQVVVWENKDALIAPSSALFRDDGDWTVFVVKDGVAKRRQVKVGKNNGIEAQVLDGLEPDEAVILYPSSELSEGAEVTRRKIAT